MTNTGSRSDALCLENHMNGGIANQINVVDIRPKLALIQNPAERPQSGVMGSALKSDTQQAIFFYKKSRMIFMKLGAVDKMFDKKTRYLNPLHTKKSQ